MPIICFILGLLFASQAWAYPEFIGYKYSSCLTCHYNSQGNGAINDYGRALWASEIAGRAFAGSATDEQLGEASGFLGRKELPWWVRPGLKSRYMTILSNPGGRSDSRGILMQAEGNVAIHFDQEQKYVFVSSFGYIPVPQRLKLTGGSADEWISREHYLRYQMTESTWVYAGMMDKVFGLRISNHSAYSRTRTGLNQNDQAHGLMIHYIQPKWEFTFNPFMGNMFQDGKLRQVGASAMVEVEIKEAWRLGLSILTSGNEYVKNERIAVHSKAGLGHGSSLLFEAGLTTDESKADVENSNRGYYIFSQAMQRVARGYHLFVSGQAYKDRMIAERDNNLKASFGMLAFPRSRTEFRIEFENSRTYGDSPEVTDESWAALAQIHISL